jgi:hypothetical protein
MKSAMRAALVFALMAVVSVSFGQDEEKKGKKKKPAREPQAIVAIQKGLAKIEVNDEQKAKIDKLFADAKEKLAAIGKTRTELLGKGGAGKAAAARKKANADGKKGKEAQAAIQEALGLDDEKFATFNELGKKNRGVTQGLRKAVAALFTAEQVKTAGLGAQKRGNRNKPANAGTKLKTPEVNLKDKPGEAGVKVKGTKADLKDKPGEAGVKVKGTKADLKDKPADVGAKKIGKDSVKPVKPGEKPAKKDKKDK